MQRRSFIIGGAAMIAVGATGYYFTKDLGKVKNNGVPDNDTDLPEIFYGDSNSKIEVVEYLSMTCIHCGNFMNKVFPEIKKNYIDNGKVKWVVREFPLDPVAFGISMILRTVPKEQYLPLMDLFLRQQETWMNSNDKIGEFLKITNQVGINRDKIETIFKNDELYQKLEKIKKAAIDAGVNGTPSFFINGSLQVGEMLFDDFKKIVDPLISN